MNMALHKDIEKILKSLPVVSSHEHHLPDVFQEKMNLDLILDYAYIGWYAGRPTTPNVASLKEDPLLPVHADRKKYSLPDNNWEQNPKNLHEERKKFLDLFGYNSYWVWLEKGIKEIYGLSESILPDNWEKVSSQIADRHKKPGADLEIMREHGGYIGAVQDTYWDYASDLGHPDFFSPTMRIDMFITCYNPTVLDHDLNNPFVNYTNAPSENFDDYLDFVKKLFYSWRDNGAVAMKCASAYERPIDFGSTSRNKAAEIFGKPESEIADADRIAFGDFMFHWFCELNKELDIPFQVHTGLAEISGSNPMLFEPVIKKYPEIQFVLFHAGYPWYSQVAGLAHNYDNVFIDMVWAPLISTSAAVQALKEYIEVAQTSNLIGWGGDTWTSEEAVGAVLAWKFVVSRALSDMVSYGYMDLKKAENLANKLMYKNNAAIYGFQV